MPTARELLEQAGALMRRNRERALHAERAAGIPEGVPGVRGPGAGIPEAAAATPEPAAANPEPAAANPEPAVAIAEPAAAIAEPAAATPEPATTITESAAATPEPATTITESAAATPEPATTITESAAATPEPPTTIVEPAAAIAEPAASVPEPGTQIPELTDVVTTGAPLARRSALDEVPVLLDAVELDRAVEGDDTAERVPPDEPVEAVGIAKDAVQPEVADTAPEASRPDRGEPAERVEPGEPVEIEKFADEPWVADTVQEASRSDRGSRGGDAPAMDAEALPSRAVDAPEREPRRLWSLFSFGRKAETAAAAPAMAPAPPSDEGSRAAAAADGTVAGPPAVESWENAAPATGSVENSGPQIDAAESSPALPVDVVDRAAATAVGEGAPAPAPLSQDAGAPPAGDGRAPAEDRARWEALAEEVRTQVLQRIDIFTDTRLREQLDVQLQPIVDRASAELVATISEQVGTLVRAHIAEAIEREIETWRKGNT